MFLKKNFELYQTASRATKFSLSFWNVMDVAEKFCIQRFSNRRVRFLLTFETLAIKMDLKLPYINVCYFFILVLQD